MKTIYGTNKHPIIVTQKPGKSRRTSNETFVGKKLKENSGYDAILANISRCKMKVNS